MGMKEDIIFSLNHNDIREENWPFKVLSSSLLLFDGVIVPYDKIASIRIYGPCNEDDKGRVFKNIAVDWDKRYLSENEPPKIEMEVLVVTRQEYAKAKRTFTESRQLKWRMAARDFIFNYASYFGDDPVTVLFDEW